MRNIHGVSWASQTVIKVGHAQQKQFVIRANSANDSWMPPKWLAAYKKAVKLGTLTQLHLRQGQVSYYFSYLYPPLRNSTGCTQPCDF